MAEARVPSPARCLILQKTEGAPEIGYTTGSCAAAAAGAAARILATGERVEHIFLTTPSGIGLLLEVEEVRRSREAVTCGVRKSGGADRDVTHGVRVLATVAWEEGEADQNGFVTQSRDLRSHLRTQDHNGIQGPGAQAARESEGDAARGAKEGILSDSFEVAQSRDGLPRSEIGGRLECAERGAPGVAAPSVAGQPHGFHAPLPEGEGIRILGGSGVGRVTLPGLDQPVGEAAINRVPREMIRRAVADALGGTARVRVLIEILGGEALAERTFNPRLGIVGGLSVLGTSGIVRPMSEDAMRQTIRAELSVHRALGEEAIALVPGNYGMEYLRSHWGFPEGRAVTVSNYIGDALAMAVTFGYHKVLLAGHLGKLIKVAAGMPNTHSSRGDRRMETLAQIAREVWGSSRRGEGQTGISGEELRRALLCCVSTDRAMDLLEDFGLAAPVLRAVAARVRRVLLEWAGGAVHAEVLVFACERGAAADALRVGMTPGAGELLQEMGQRNCHIIT